MLFNSTTSDGYTSEVAAWLVLSTGGNTTGDPGDVSDIVIIDHTIWSEGAPTIACIPSRIYVLPSLQLSTPITFSFPPLVTTLTTGWYGSPQDWILARHLLSRFTTPRPLFHGMM